MTMNDTLATAMSNIQNAEKIGRKEVIIRPYSKMAKKVLEIMQNHHYIGDFEIIEDGKGNFIKINLIGAINKCGVIKPRFSVKKDNFEKFEKRYLPAKDFGIIILSTSQGVLTLEEAKEKVIGGRLIAYIY
ncbi:MAG: 30S ribosomal protein S8 [Nanoarchaeota archaeon]|nr:30S ribosomal protein S8 [Nanoarchaeota archaeon]MBU4242100.1 30S ribosomal protein S8 [Nanoarchaeota archaeon]MBU4352463.1 30S ribosomal protein S8 [Nanoarchaeota archaeon]